MRYLIVADDLTGANASGVLAAKIGIKALSCFYDAIPDDLDSYELVSISTNSRNIPPNEAYARVKEVLNKVYSSHIKVVTKRIDSTLRGNLGAELDAFLNYFQKFVAFVVPAYPDSGRITIGGRMLVNGRPLQETEVAKDPGSPINTSNVLDLLSKQTKQTIMHIPVEILLTDKVGPIVLNACERGIRIFVFDAATNEHIEKISKVVLGLNLNFIAVDPGPFTANLIANLHGKRRVLFLIGSTADFTKAQVRFLKLQLSYEVNTYEVNISDFLLLEERELSQEIEKLVKKILNESRESICITTSSKIDLDLFAEKLALSKTEVASKIDMVMARIGKRLLDSTLFTGLFVSGGDTTKAILEVLNAKGIEILGEIYPLVCFGKITGGRFNGLKIVTKGGLVGQIDTLGRSIAFLWTD